MGLNQADHRAAGLAAADAVRDAGNRWVFPELLAGGLEPHAAITAAGGRAAGVEHAVTLRAIDLQAPPPLLDGTA